MRCIILITLLLLWSCGNRSEKGAGVGDSELGLERNEAPEQDIPTTKLLSPQEEDFKQVKQTQDTDKDTVEIGKQIIRIAQLNFQVQDFKEATEKIQQVAKANQAYISSANERNNGYTLDGEMVVRVPSKNFDKAIKEILEIAIYVNFKNESAEDVTEEFVDVITRLKTKREVEKRYLEILSRAKTISEILEVEEKLRVIREEIESREGRLKYLKNQVQFSTIHLNYYQTNEKYQKPPKASFLNKVGESLVEGWEGLLGFLIGLVSVWPLLIAVAGVAWWWIRRRKKKKNQTPT
ncbi:protein of unknown function [Thermoflexibacter ruber]|uniref:DUF4349 domain-containing protein n=2 Tax=Thermoflexibacter ruber TaxID=1003 RepID=A0A1I2J7B8_9BACT|nr:protein of unknown function [Thermoflexibacter ruber]